MTRRAKIVATLGPATASEESIQALVDAGMDVARLNLSHGTHEQHRQSYLRVRRASDASARAVGVLADLQGPKIRLGTFADGPVDVGAGHSFTITTEHVPGTAERVSTTYPGLPEDVSPGDRVVVDDGRIVLEVAEIDGPRVRTRVTSGGTLSDHKGVNLPGVTVSAPALTDKDVEDLRWALHLRADMVALSFVRHPGDADAVRRIMGAEGVALPVLAKLERPEAVEDLAGIADAFDGIMIARGDLGVELALEQVPMVQKQAIDATRERGKPVIVATQMLESMITAPRPTRAETSDVANAVLDGTDAAMLSGETSVGSYPVGSVRTMSRTIAAAESATLHAGPVTQHVPETTGDALARAAVEVGAATAARALVSFTTSGTTARRLARYRSLIPLLAFTSKPETRSQLALSWGVETFLVDEVDHTDDMVRQVEAALLDLDRYQKGDPVVIVAGSPLGVPGNTNMLRVHRLGEMAGHDSGGSGRVSPDSRQ